MSQALLRRINGQLDRPEDQQVAKEYEQVIQDHAWWQAYYKRTNDWSVGPAITLSCHAQHNVPTFEKTVRVYRHEKKIRP